MPIWGWICVGLLVAVVAVVILLVVIVKQYERGHERLMRDGETVVARIYFAHPCLYDPDDGSTFSAAFVVFTMDNDNSEEHLEYLKGICDQLDDFKPSKRGDEDEQTIGRALAQQTTVGLTPLRLPDRITDGADVYFATPNVFRRMLPEGQLTLDYIYLKVLIDGDYRDLAMIEYPGDEQDDE